MAGASLSLVWKGDELKEKFRGAQRSGVNKTMGDAVNQAKRVHPWKNRTGILEGGIAIQQMAVQTARGVAGSWGVFDVAYALAQELGAVIRPVKAKALKIPQPDGSFRFVKQVVLHPKPYLRPAADAIYPQLAANIRRAAAAGGARG